MHLGYSVGLYILCPLEVHQGVVPGELLVGICWLLYHLCHKLSHVKREHEAVHYNEWSVRRLINDLLFSLCVCPSWATKSQDQFLHLYHGFKKIIDYDSLYKLMWFPIRDTILSIITVIRQNISRNHRHLCLFSYSLKIFFHSKRTEGGVYILCYKFIDTHLSVSLE